MKFDIKRRGTVGETRVGWVGRLGWRHLAQALARWLTRIATPPQAPETIEVDAEQLQAAEQGLGFCDAAIDRLRAFLVRFPQHREASDHLADLLVTRRALVAALNEREEGVPADDARVEAGLTELAARKVGDLLDVYEDTNDV